MSLRNKSGGLESCGPLASATYVFNVKKSFVPNSYFETVTFPSFVVDWTEFLTVKARI